MPSQAHGPGSYCRGLKGHTGGYLQPAVAQSPDMDVQLGLSAPMPTLVLFL